MAPIDTGPSAPPSLAPSRVVCVRHAIGPRGCHLETQLDFETLAGDALNLCVLSNVQRRSCPTPSKRRLRANGGSRPRQNRSWPIASQSSRAAAERGEPQFKVSQGLLWSAVQGVLLPTTTSLYECSAAVHHVPAPFCPSLSRSLCPSPLSPAS